MANGNGGIKMIHSVLGIIVILCAGSVWLANTHFMAEANQNDIEYIGELQREVVKDVATIQTDIAYIKNGQCEIKELIKSFHRV